MSVYDRDDYYSGPPPPPLHGHPQSPPMRSAYDNTGYTSPHSTAYPPTPFDHQDDSRRNRKSIDAALYHNEAAMGWRTNRGSMSDVKLTGHYDSDDEHDLLPVPEERKRRSCMDKLCCGCCTCLPRWMRYLCCVLFLIIIALAIVVGVLAALFKTPNVTFNGIEGEPQVNLVGTNITMNFTLSISVDNPNIEGITFEKIVAEAYYPNYDNVSIGGGELDDVHIAKQATTNISFPFSIQIDASSESTKAIASDMMNKCGLTGGSSSQITIDYKVKPTLRIIGIPITPTISESANIDCPTQELSGLTGLASDWESLIPSGVLPTGAT